MAVIDDLTFFALFGLIATVMIKLYNVMKFCDLYDKAESVIILCIGVVCYLFIEMGLFLNLTIEYNVYFLISRIFILLLVVLWFAEILMYAAISVVEPFTRMDKRKNERYQNFSNIFKRG